MDNEVSRRIIHEVDVYAQVAPNHKVRRPSRRGGRSSP